MTPMTSEDIPKDGDKPFYENDLIGNAVETRLRRILADSGYIVMPFLKEEVDELHDKTREWKGNMTVERVRSAPDLYVTIADPELVKEQTHFVEVKYRTSKSADNVRLGHPDQLERQVHFWQDAILVIFTPKDPYWYAQGIKALESKIHDAAQNNFTTVNFNLLEEFSPITKFFPQIDSEKLSGYTKPLLRLIKSLRPPSE